MLHDLVHLIHKNHLAAKSRTLLLLTVLFVVQVDALARLRAARAQVSTSFGGSSLHPPLTTKEYEGDCWERRGIEAGEPREVACGEDAG